ncbi:hypothetical protein WJX84_007296 [Apatococcus fuscideae]|uniref:GRIP domain-containing protein n=1 Tax=Apatococcus fuscideae TaxID=2026836 RepID=A0AAW1T497_9CHLO
MQLLRSSDDLQARLQEAQAEHQELVEKLADATRGHEQAAAAAKEADTRFKEQLQASEDKAAKLQEALSQAFASMDSQRHASAESFKANEDARAGMAAEVGRLEDQTKNVSAALVREQDAALSAVRKLEEQLQMHPKQSVNQDNLEAHRSEALEAVKRLEDEIVAGKLAMADRIEGRIAAEARAADFAINADVANLRHQKTYQRLRRTSTELERVRRDSADNFEQLQRSSAELKRSSAELQRMRSAPGSSGLESLEEGADKAVQLVLQIISDTASSGGMLEIDRAAVARLTEENDSLKSRINQLGSLLSSNTIGGSSMSKASNPEGLPSEQTKDGKGRAEQPSPARASSDSAAAGKSLPAGSPRAQPAVNSLGSSASAPNTPRGHHGRTNLKLQASHFDPAKAQLPKVAPYDALDTLWFGRPCSSPGSLPPSPTPPPTRLPHIAHLDLHHRRSRLNTSRSSLHQFQLSAPSTPTTTPLSQHLQCSPALEMTGPFRSASMPISTPCSAATATYSPSSTPTSCPHLRPPGSFLAGSPVHQAHNSGPGHPDPSSKGHSASATQQQSPKAAAVADSLPKLQQQQQHDTHKQRTASHLQEETSFQPVASTSEHSPIISLNITVSSESASDASPAASTGLLKPNISLPEAPELETQASATSLLSPCPPGTLPELAERTLDAAVASAVQVAASEATANGNVTGASSKGQDSQELAEVKRKFLLVMKKKQQEFVKKVKELEAAAEEATSRVRQLEQQATAARDAQEMEQQTVRSAATSEASELQRRLEEQAASLKQQVSEHREAAERAESIAQAAQSEASELRSKSMSDLQSHQESWQARYAELEAEVSRLKQDVESERAGRAKLREDVEGERERVKKAITEFKRKTDRAVRDCKKAEQEAESVRSKAEDEKEELRDQIAAADKRIQQAQQGAKALAIELREYKARAHSLLKAKDADLRTAAETVRQEYAEQLADAESASAQARSTADQERQNAHRWQEQLQEGLAEQSRQHELEIRHLRGDIAREQAGHQEASKSSEMWRIRAEAAEGRAEALKEERRRAPDASPAVLQQHAAQVQALQLRLENLQADFDTFRQTSEQMLEAKDFQLQQSLETNAELRSQSSTLRRELEEQQQAQQSVRPVQGPWRQDISPGPGRSGSAFLHRSPSAGLDDRWEAEDQWADAGSQVSFPSSRPAETTASGILEDMSFDSGLQESALLKLAGKQAAREEELGRMRDRTRLLEAEVADLQQEVDLRQQQEVALKEAMRDYEREKARAALASKHSKDLEYLKNILLKLFETGEAAALLPVVAMMLHFSPQELKQCQEAMLRRQAEAAEANAASAVGAGSDAGDGSYLGSWTAWAFGGEGQPGTPRLPSTPRVSGTPRYHEPPLPS